MRVTKNNGDQLVVETNLITILLPILVTILFWSAAVVIFLYGRERAVTYLVGGFIFLLGIAPVVLCSYSRVTLDSRTRIATIRRYTMLAVSEDQYRFDEIKGVKMTHLRGNRGSGTWFQVVFVTVRDLEVPIEDAVSILGRDYGVVSAIESYLSKHE